MAHFIVKRMNKRKTRHMYLYHRRVGSTQAEARAVWGPDVGQARVFTTKSAASNSSSGAGEIVSIVLNEVAEAAE